MKGEQITHIAIMGIFVQVSAEALNGHITFHDFALPQFKHYGRMTNVANGPTWPPLVHQHQVNLFVLCQPLSIGTNFTCYFFH
jgi:hypothetical protein